MAMPVKPTKFGGRKRGRAFLLYPLLCAALMAACDAPQTDETLPFNATEVKKAQFGRDFHLRDADGQEHTLADWRGKVVLLFFGYTHCPDACPTSLFRAARVMELLGAEAEKVQVLFITLDPARDTPEVLREYPTAFHPGFLGLYAAPEDTPRLARDFQVFYKVNPGSTPETYSIDHSINTYAYDPEGRLRLVIGHDAAPEAVAEDIRLLLGQRPTASPS
jgi:protein SCO1/2